MNSSQVQSSDSVSHDRVEFQRFQGIWNNIKKAKETSSQSNQYQKQSSNRKSIISVKKAIEEEEQKNLQTRLVLTQKQLKKAKQNTNLLLKKLSEAQEQIEYLEYELQKQVKEKEQILEQFQELRLTYSSKQKQRTSQLQKSTLRGNQTDTEVQKLNKKLQFKEREVDKLNLKLKSLQMNARNQQNEIRLMNENAKLCQRKLQETERSLFLNQEQTYGNGKGSQILQLEQAYNTIERLTILLKNTEEYKHFAIKMQDFKSNHFLKNIQQRLKKSELLQKVTPNKKMCSCMQIKIDQKLLWSPSICYKKVLQLKLKYQGLSEQCIEQLLFELNRIYLSKQEAGVAKLKETYQNRLSEIKKKNQMRYDEMVARKQIQRLKKQVLTERYSKGKGSRNIQLQENIEMLKSIGQYEDELKIKQKQIYLLKERIRLMQIQNNNYDKILYLEGTLWILDRVLLQIQANNEDMTLFESKFRDKITQSMTQEQWINSFKYLFENIAEIQNNLIQKLIGMKESTIKKLGSQKGQGYERSMEHQASFRN